MELEARIVPNAKKFAVSLKGEMLKSGSFSTGSLRNVEGWIRVRVSSRAEDGNANKELVQKLGKALGRKVTLLRGMKSRVKTLEIEGGEEEVMKLLRKIANESEK